MRPPGSGQLYEKWGSYYGRWRTPDGRRLNRKLGQVRTKGSSDGLTRAQAEQAFRRVRAEEAARKPVEPVVEILTVDQVADRLREWVAIEGAQVLSAELRVDAAGAHLAGVGPAQGRGCQHRGCRAAREPHVRSRRVAEDGAQRDDVSALGVRVGGSQGVGCE